ncbi:ABC transporter ATP-binding protein [Campylobacter sp. RM16187]|uniref:ABC transporter ATP-binding protein n=1 Tax=Campylobacter sp. RM16187 TaxID=1660063 RepID=UPI0021B51C4B|nr:ABC transporter ATP-binding protein [Campylobacter sp. RM16187]QKG29952.1 copper ABC transporter NosDFY, putative ATP-binding protein NosF [Campylobacter sp. RM16187]
MIEIKNVSKTFGSQQILKNINIEILENEKVVLLGQNGAGKSSLIKVILGEYIPDKGYVKILGTDPLKSRKEALDNISFVPQTPPPLRLTLSELCEFVCESSQVSLEDIEQICERMGLKLKDNLNKAFYKLSGGMKQKLLIAIAFAKDSKIMIFDEPTANLDIDAREQFLALLNEFAKEKTIIFISHRVSDMRGFINREIYMDLGAVVQETRRAS